MTTIEIDPIIHRYAVDYFHLPSNHTSIIDDAITYVLSASHKGSEKYTYIIHDVFTGGAEPASLFTVEFLSGLQNLLKPNGVIVIVREIPAPFPLNPKKSKVTSKCRITQAIWPPLRRALLSAQFSRHFRIIAAFLGKTATTLIDAMSKKKLTLQIWQSSAVLYRLFHPHQIRMMRTGKKKQNPGHCQQKESPSVDRSKPISSTATPEKPFSFPTLSLKSMASRLPVPAHMARVNSSWKQQSCMTQTWPALQKAKLIVRSGIGS